MRGKITISTCVAAASAAVQGIATFVQAVAFWTAALLPLVYVPLLFAGHGAVASPGGIGKLVGLHLATLVVGHGYGGEIVEAVAELY